MSFYVNLDNIPSFMMSEMSDIVIEEKKTFMLKVVVVKSPSIFRTFLVFLPQSWWHPVCGLFVVNQVILIYEYS